MAVSIPYMGTKRQLANTVAELVSECRSGPFLDMFSGMCSVGTAVAPARQVWSNDLQHFANSVAKAYFCSKHGRPNAVSMSELCLRKLRVHQNNFDLKYADFINAEETNLIRNDAKTAFLHFDDAITTSNHLELSAESDYEVFVRRYAGSYFSYRQAVEIDGIRSALDALLSEGEIDAEAHQWALVSLCIAMSKCTTTTGHFAQPLAPKKRNFSRFKAQRRRQIWNEWTRALSEMAAIGSRDWRKKNLVFQHEASGAILEIARQGYKPGVVYADPPYTKDQYSRYYHVFETAVLYDRPQVSGRGIYRSDRAVSPFCLATQVDSAIDSLVYACAEIGADLVMSYPKNGVMINSSIRIPEMMRKYYKRSVDVFELNHLHSTLGGSKGAQSNGVIEVIYRVRH